MKDNTNQGITAYPLCWPTGWARAKHRTSSPYKITTDAAIEELFGEIRMLGGRDCIVSSNVPIRRDGTMYRGDHSDQRIADPGVAVYWTMRGPKGEALPKVLPCDAWHTVRENVRALGMAIGYLRGLKRCGAGEIQDRAFEGFARLPESTGADPWTILGVPKGVSRQRLNERLRELTRTEHPDNGGNTATFARITAAFHEALASTP